MIKSLSLHNFQSHKQSELEFDPGVNVIVGPSDSGKTAIIRALRWLVWGRPLGDSFIHHGEHLCSVSVSVQGHVVKREKTKGGETSYSFLNRMYTAMKTEVPEQIRQFLNMGEVNIQQQLDRPFLLDSSPGEVAQHFNRVARLDVIDIGMKRILSWSRSLGQAITAKEDLLESLEESLEDFAYIEEADAKLVALESAQGQLSSLQSQIETIENLMSRVFEIEEEQKEYQSKIKLGSKIDSMLSLMEDRKNKNATILAISKQTESYLLLKDREEIAQAKVRLGPKIESLISLREGRNDQEAIRGQLFRLIHHISDTESSIVTQQEKIARLEKIFKSSFPEVCPLCGQKMRG